MPPGPSAPPVPTRGPGALLVLVGVLVAMVVVWAAAVALGGDEGVDAGGPTSGGGAEASAPPDAAPSGGGADDGVTVVGGGGDRPALALIGDSIFDGAEAELTDRFGGTWELRLHAVSGRTTLAQVPAAQEVAAMAPPADQVVVNLGTNDVTSQRSLDESEAALLEIVAAFPDARCIHPVTVTDRRRDGERIERWPEAEALNATWRGVAASDPRIRVVDWADLLRQADGSEPVLLEDQVHPSPDGNRVLVDAVAASVESCP